MIDKVKDFFKRYPNSDEVFENGGLLFLDSGSADSYGKSETRRWNRKEAAEKPEEVTQEGEVSEEPESEDAPEGEVSEEPESEDAQEGEVSEEPKVVKTAKTKK